MGEVDGAELSLDEAAVTFVRRGPPALVAEATLRPYTGTYRSPSGGKVEVVYQPGVGLVLPGREPVRGSHDGGVAAPAIIKICSS